MLPLKFCVEWSAILADNKIRGFSQYAGADFAVGLDRVCVCVWVILGGWMGCKSFIFKMKSEYCKRVSVGWFGCAIPRRIILAYHYQIAKGPII